MYQDYLGKVFVGKIFGSIHHMLVSLWGRRWRKVQLIMFALFVDDSGTDPSQHVAIATALVIPAIQIVRLEDEWEKFRKKESFKCFHTSELVTRNPKESLNKRWL